MTPSEEQVRSAVAQQAGTWFIANQSGSLEHAERAAFVAWLKASPIHVEEYLGVALVAHDLPAAAEDPQLPLESLIELARADDTDGVVVRSRHRCPCGNRLEAHDGAAYMVICHVDCRRGRSCWPHRYCGGLRDGEFLGCRRPTRRRTANRGSVQLPDGSELHLNTDSAVTVRYTRSERAGRDCARSGALLRLGETTTRRFRVAAGDAHVSLWEPSLISTADPTRRL